MTQYTTIQERYWRMEDESDMNSCEIAIHADNEMDSGIIRFAHFSEFIRDDRDKLYDDEIAYAYQNVNGTIVLVDEWGMEWDSGVTAILRLESN